jgi:catechol 2,3-dioxygenase-like lactoylglutathione lyase family enzyme
VTRRANFHPAVDDLDVFTGSGLRCIVMPTRQLRPGTLGEPMSIELNHSIVHVKDRWAASRDVGQVLGLPEATGYGPFAELKLHNAVSLDFMDSDGEIHGQHYAFLVGEEDFDLILGRLRDNGRQWWADPFKRQPNEINHEDGGRGLYWEGPDGHWLEIITRPYGSGG